MSLIFVNNSLTDNYLRHQNVKFAAFAAMEISSYLAHMSQVRLYFPEKEARHIFTCLVCARAFHACDQFSDPRLNFDLRGHPT